MKRSVAASLILFALSFVAAGPVHSDSIDDEARRIAQEVQCPVCQGASVAESPSQLAAQMRGIIRSKLEAGETREAILAYFADRYGESVLMTPPRSGLALVIWLAPYVGGLAILGLVFWMVRRRRPVPTVGHRADSALDPYLAEVDRAAEEMRGQPLR